LLSAPLPAALFFDPVQPPALGLDILFRLGYPFDQIVLVHLLLQRADAPYSCAPNSCQTDQANGRRAMPLRRIERQIPPLAA